MTRRSVTASDREALIRLASSLPTGSEERRAILAGLSQRANLDYDGLDNKYDTKKAIHLYDAFARKIMRGIDGNPEIRGNILANSKRETIGVVEITPSGANEASHAVWLTIEPWTNGCRYTVVVRAFEPGSRGRLRRWEDSGKSYELDNVLKWRADRAISEINSDIQTLAQGHGAVTRYARRDKTAKRPLYEIAEDIKRDWKNVYFGAVPYLQAMSTMDSIRDPYGADPGYEIVAYFLANATGWRGPVAKAIKAELKAMLR